MIIPRMRYTANLLRALPSYLQEAPGYPKYHLNIGREYLPYMWFIRYVNESNSDVFCIAHGKSIGKAAFKMLLWLMKHKKEYIDF